MTALSLSGTFFYLFFTSTLLGILVGLLSAYIIKTLYIERQSTDREIAIMIIMAYLSYMSAKLMSLSGILTVFFCGIVMSHYTWHNITHSSRTTTKHTLQQCHSLQKLSSSCMLVWMHWILINGKQAMQGRATFVFPLVNFANYFNNNEGTRVNYREQGVHS